MPRNRPAPIRARPAERHQCIGPHQAATQGFAAASTLALGPENGQGHQHQKCRQNGGGPPVETTGVLEEYRPGEGVVAKQRHGSEVGHRVERDQERCIAKGWRDLWKRHGSKATTPSCPQAAGNLVERWVEALERRHQSEVDVGVREQDQSQRGPPETARDRYRPQSKGRNQFGNHSLPAGGSEKRQRPHVGRNDERQSGEGRPNPPTGDIGPAREPGSGETDGARSTNDGDNQKERVDCQLGQATCRQDPDPGPAQDRAPDEQGQGKYQREHQQGGKRPQSRRCRPLPHRDWRRRLWDLDGGGCHRVIA